MGPWKTGSTALQEFFKVNRSKLLSNCVLYPIGIVAGNAHHELPNTLSQTMSRFSWVPKANQITLIELAAGYFEDMKVNGASTLLLSSEDFAGLNSDQFHQFIQSFSKVDDCNFEFVYFDFDPDERLASYQNQFIRQGEFVDDLALKQLLEEIRGFTPSFLNATKEIPAIVHRYEYQQLKTPTDIFEKVAIAGPGFINVYFKKEYIYSKIIDIINANENYGKSNIGNNLKINIYIL
jgi:hypothetical protein